MNPNIAFKTRKIKSRPASGGVSGVINAWECMECGWKRNIYGDLKAGGRWLVTHPRCDNCGHTNPGWQA
jgi:hypothetical protein